MMELRRLNGKAFCDREQEKQYQVSELWQLQKEQNTTTPTTTTTTEKKRSSSSYRKQSKSDEEATTRSL